MLSALFLFFFCFPDLGAETLVSPSWGFQIDLPEGYFFAEGDGKNQFAFQSIMDTSFDIRVYAPGVYPSAEELARDVQRRIGNKGEISPFVYRQKKAVLISLDFNGNLGWGLCVELEETTTGGIPLLLALSYAPENRENVQIIHLSALDSIRPSAADRLAPGPLTEFAYPRGERKRQPLWNMEDAAAVYEFDAEAAQSVVDREFSVFINYLNTELWKEAWIRYYRTIYADSYERLADISFIFERSLNKNVLSRESGQSTANRDNTGAESSEAVEFAAAALKWVQSFSYERDFEGSDFVNLVSAAFEGRGDCDSRAMLWAIMLEQNNIPATIMVSQEYQHAMGLVDLPGTGARFEFEGKKWLVAETTAKVPMGLIAADSSEIEKWTGIKLE